MIAPGVAWDRSEALRGLACAIPGAVVAALWDVGLGCALVLGTLCVALLGVPSRRAARPRLFVGALLFAGAYALGATVVAWPVVAVVALAALAYAAVINASRGPLARLVPALVVPAFALGMNHPVPAGLVLAATFLAGGLWATIVTTFWPAPRTAPPTSPAPAAPPPMPAANAPAATTAVAHRPTATRDPRPYAVLFALAGAMGLSIGFVVGFVHVAWSAGAALLIMRPVPDLTARRSIERVVATFLGITAAAAVMWLDPSSIGIAIVVALALALIVGTRTSTWYLSSGGTGLVVLLMAGLSGSSAFEATYTERLVETAIGAMLALLLGVLAPRLLASRVALSPPPS